MRRRFVLAAAIVLLAAGCGGEEREASPPAQSKPAPSREAEGILGFLWSESGGRPELARLDPLTLEPSGRRLELAPDSGLATLSPDFRTLAIGSGEKASVQFVDIGGMRSLANVELGVRGWVTLLTWQRGYLFAVVAGQYDHAVVTLDPVGRRVQARHLVDGAILHARRGIQGVVLLLGPPSGIGPLRLAVVGGKGMTTTRIPGFVGGWVTEQEGDDVRTRQQIPALVVDEVGKRAFVVSGRSVAEVSLRNLSVKQHTLSEPVSLLGRLLDWLDPAAYAKFVDGTWRHGTWVGDGLLAVSGADYATVTDAEGEMRVDAKPAGVSLIDTRDWSVRTINEEATEVMVFESTLLAYGVTYYEDASTEGFGLVGYDLGGEERFRLFEGTGVGWLQRVGGLAYATWDKRFAVIDAASGELVAEPATKQPITLVES